MKKIIYIWYIDEIKITKHRVSGIVFISKINLNSIKERANKLIITKKLEIK